MRAFDARMPTYLSEPPLSRLSSLCGPFSSRSMRSFSVAEAAALAAVRYARLADEKNKRRRNVERQKELVDTAVERGRRESVERRGTEGVKDAADASCTREERERKREREKMTGRGAGCQGSEREGIRTRAA